MAQDLVIHVLADTKQAVEGLRQTQEEIKRLTEQTRTFTGIIAGLQTFRAAWGLLSGVIAECTAAARDNADAMRRLNAALMISGRYSRETARGYADFAAKLSEVTDYAAADITRVVAHFARLGLTDQVLRQATRTTLDLAAALNTDLSTAALALGKALANPAEGMSMLVRHGVVLTEQQREYIRTLAEAGHQTEAQVALLQILAGQFQGFAEAISDPVKRMKNAWTELEAAFGEAIRGIQASLAVALVPELNNVRGEVEKTRESLREFMSSVQQGVMALITVLYLAYHVFNFVAGMFALGIAKTAAQVQVLVWALEKLRVVRKGSSDEMAAFATEMGKRSLTMMTGIKDVLDFYDRGVRRLQQETTRSITPPKDAFKGLAESLQKEADQASKILDRLREEWQTLGMAQAQKQVWAIQKAGGTADQIAEAQHLASMIEARKQQLDVEKRIADLRRETMFMGMEETQRRLAELQLAGATAAQLDQARQLLEVQKQIREQQEAQRKAQEEQNRLAQEAAAIRREIMTDEQKIAEQVAKANQLLKAGLISPQEYIAYLQKIKATISPPADMARQLQQPQLTAALRIGTAEAYSAIIRSAMMAIRPPSGGSQEQTAKNTQQIVQRLDRLIALVARQEAV